MRVVSAIPLALRSSSVMYSSTAHDCHWWRHRWSRSNVRARQVAGRAYCVDADTDELARDVVNAVLAEYLL